MIERLVVVIPFRGFVRGDIIADRDLINQVLEENIGKFVTKIAPMGASKG